MWKKKNVIKVSWLCIFFKYVYLCPIEQSRPFVVSKLQSVLILFVFPLSFVVLAFRRLALKLQNKAGIIIFVYKILS